MNQALMILLLALGAHSSSAVDLPEMTPVVRLQQQDSPSILSARLYLRDLAKQMEQTEIQSDGTAERLSGSMFPKTKEGRARKC